MDTIESISLILWKYYNYIDNESNLIATDQYFDCIF